ncbi:probable RNA-directed DNA polymerase from transposon X-element [Trichonephila clavipes]|nr:probable RNA-directed DNA polymerase from transposon X-element [Trichonephila clavipes]
MQEFGNTDLCKSPDLDGIHGSMIDCLGLDGRRRLLDIFNISWKLGRLPHDWKRSTDVPIKKPQKDARFPESYRPIALTSISCKIMEKMFLKRLSFYLNSRDLLPREHYGFKPGHGTTDQVLYFSQKIRDAQNLKPTHHTVAAFLDLSKAFDTVWKQKLITKLFDSFGNGDRALPWLYDFLCNRTIRVKFNSSMSKEFKLSQGLPQEYVLSPTLFTLFMWGIEEVISRRCEEGLFANNIVIWKSVVLMFLF